MPGIAQSWEQARTELMWLREERGQGTHTSVLVSSLHHSLRLLSDELYQTPTHFLLELVQNADDNSYAPGITPALCLQLYKEDFRSFLRTGCNEVGFSMEQLDALLRVGQSTKSTNSNQRGYIGEKGIGFKSVFKVAGVVHVKSGFYEFKLDRNQTLGMILPVLSGFPLEARDRNATTQFLLELNNGYIFEEIRKELQSIEPELLIFLRRLEQLQIATPSADKTFIRQVCKFNNLLGGETVTILEQFKDQVRNLTYVTNYIVQRHEIRHRWIEPRRAGVSVSEVIVALPVKNMFEPEIGSQMAFAFLPIDDFGFRFLIHADFLLVASRESLEYGNEWNMELRDGIRIAFLKAIQRCMVTPRNELGDGLCYTWPSYLPRGRGNRSFWNDLHEDILTELRHAPVLQSRHTEAGLLLPTSLYYVPPKFRDSSGHHTLFELPSIKQSHLSFNYDRVRVELSLIGVGTLDIRGLLQEFTAWVATEGPMGLEAMPDAWHTQVSALFSGDVRLLDGLRSLPIIPLQDGSWVGATTAHVYLASQNQDEHVPAGVKVSVIDGNASRNPVRRQFFEFLGIRPYEANQICDLILELHRGSAMGLDHRADEDLISDAAYLFRHKRFLTYDAAPDIWYATQQCGKRSIRKSPIYFIDSTANPSLIDKYKDKPNTPFAVLDPRYEAVICQENEYIRQEFHQWLLRSLTSSFAAYPILVRNENVTVEWTFLRRESKLDLLRAVKANLMDISMAHITAGYSTLQIRVPSLLVMVKGFGLLPLRDVAVPTKELVQECPHLPFAELLDPAIQDWGFLSAFGVLVQCNTTARLQELKALSSLSPAKTEEKTVHSLYLALSKARKSEQAEIQGAFHKHPLVFIARPQPRWIHPNQCVWSAPKPLVRAISLDSYYKDCMALFWGHLEVKEAGIDHIVDELCSMADDGFEDPVRRFEELSTLLDRFCSKGDQLVDAHVDKIRAAQVFPVRSAGATERASRAVSGVELRSLDDDGWYIPDRTPLEAAFSGKVDLLSLAVRLVQSLAGLFKCLRCEEKYLSRTVKEEIEPRGERIRALRFEKELRARLRYITSLAPDPPAGLELRVWIAASIQTSRRLGDITAKEDDGLLTIKETSQAIDIYQKADMSPEQHSEATCNLTEQLCSVFGIGNDEYALASLLMNVPVTKLKETMEKRNRFIPDEQGEDEEEEEDESNKTTETERSEHGPSEDTATMEGKPESEDLIPSGSPSEHNEPPLQEPTSSNQEKAENDVKKTADFQLAESFVTRASLISQHQEVSRGPSLALPIRARSIDYNPGFSSSAGQQPFFSPGINFDREPGSYPASASAAMPQGSNDRQSFETHSDRKTPQPQPSQSPPRSTNRGTPAAEARYREIGFLGERFVHTQAARHIKDWTFDNWTSQLRAKAGYPVFTEKEKKYSDFTYLDSSGHMKRVLRAAGISPRAGWSNNTTYHLEVKTTPGNCKEPMFVSQNQINMMRLHDADPNHAYILLRVFRIDSGHPGIMFFSSPWTLYLNKVLDFRSVGGYHVYQTDSTEETGS